MKKWAFIIVYKLFKLIKLLIVPPCFFGHQNVNNWNLIKGIFWINFKLCKLGLDNFYLFPVHWNTKILKKTAGSRPQINGDHFVAARYRTWQATCAALKQLKFEIILHLPYSPDPSSYDFHFSRDFKRDLKSTYLVGRKWEGSSEVLDHIDTRYMLQ